MPDPIEQLLAREHLARMRRKEVEQVELRRTEVDRLAIALDQPHARADDQVIEAQVALQLQPCGLTGGRVLGDSMPAHQCLDTLEQFRALKRLAEMHVYTNQTVGCIPPRAQNEDRGSAHLAHVTHCSQPVILWLLTIDDNHVRHKTSHPR